MDQLNDYFFYPDKNSKSKEYTQLREDTTVKYGVIMASIMVVIIAFIPLHNLLLARGYWVLNKVQFLRTINQLTEQLTSGQDRGMSATFRSLSSNFLRRAAYLFYMNSASLFQIFFWLSVFAILSLTNINGGDLIYLAKRLGRICAQSLPTVFFLTMRPSPLPRTLYLSLLPIHKWLSRTVGLSAIVHTLLYCGFFEVNHTWEKAWKRENLYGWAALLGFVMIIMTSFSKVRDPHYKLFFLNHYFWSWVIVLALPFHIRPVNTSTANVLDLSILIYQAYTRITMTKVSSTSDFMINHVSPNLALVEMPNHMIKKRAINPGAHVRLTDYQSNPIVWLYKQIIPNYHPYTLASLPSDRRQRLIVRKSSFLWENGRRYMVYGSFDPQLLLIKSRNTPKSNFSISKLKVNARKILIVIGGSAISFAIPILRIANYHGIPIKVVWVIRDFRDIAILSYFEGIVHGDDFEIFVTGSAYIKDEPTDPFLQNSTSYGTISNSTVKNRDLEANESYRFFNTEEDNVNKFQESENVDVDFIDSEDSSEEGECTQDFHTSCISQPRDASAEEDQILSEDESSPLLNIDYATSTISRKTSRSQSTNEQFVPQLEFDNESHENYSKTIRKLRLESHVYKGRPILNYRYYNWCVMESDVFTQCSGPVMDDSNNLICCRDLPGRQHAISGDKKLPDLQKVWVISAGPKSLVKNTKLWANENGLKYHEEAFYV